VTDQPVQADQKSKPKIHMNSQIEDSKTHTLDPNFTFIAFFYDLLAIFKVCFLNLQKNAVFCIFYQSAPAFKHLLKIVRKLQKSLNLASM
jgi:hypothetical protein